MNRKVLFVQYLGFITIGLVASIIGPLLMDIRNELHLSYSQAGFILSGQFIGILIAVLLGGLLADRYGKKLYLLTGSFLLFIGLFGSMLAGNYEWLLTFTIVSGVGFGTYEVGMNALCADTSDQNKGAAMNILHVFFGIGAVAAPVLATILLRITASWRPVFGLIGIFPMLVGVVLITLLLPSGSTAPKTKQNLPYKKGFIWLAGIAIVIYIGIESTFFGWLPAYYQSFPSLIPASLITVVFWLALTIGRLTGSWIVGRIGLAGFLIVIPGFSTILAGIWYLYTDLSGIALSMIFLLGIVLAGFYPTVMASVTSRYSDRTAEVSAFITLFMAVGGFIIPVGIGRLADWFGIAIIPLIVLGLSLLLLINTLLTWG